MRSNRTNGGYTLIEVMVSLAILMVGMLGMMQFQVLSLYWNQSGRAQSRATELALELQAGLEDLAYTDPRLAVTGGTWGTTPPTPFGSLLGSTSLAGATAWSDSNPIPGVTPDSQLERDPLNPAQPLYVRRWTVWGYTGMTSMNAGSLIIAISVVYHDKATAHQKEVVVYTERTNQAAIFANIRISS